MTSKTRLTTTALRMLDHAVSDARNNTPADERCPVCRYSVAAAAALAKAGFGTSSPDDLGTLRFNVSPEGIAFHAENGALIDSATDPLNTRGATRHY